MFFSVSSTYGQENSLHYPISAHGSMAAIQKQESSITLLVYTQSRIWYMWGNFPGKFSFLVSSTSYKPFDSEPFILCEHFPYQILLVDVVIFLYHTKFCLIRESVADWWFSPSLRTCHLGFPYDLPYVFLPLLASFRSACHAHRFRSRCSHTVLYIHYKIASQHWGIAAPNYGSFYRTSWGDEAHTFLPL